MKKMRVYELEGIRLEIPIHWDVGTGIYIEDYPDFVENPLWTAEGHPVIFAGEDACPHAMEATAGGCPDCGSCFYYHAAGEHTWFGICIHEKNNKYHIHHTTKEDREK